MLRATRTLGLCLFYAALCSAASVTFLQTDASTLGNWKGVYGQDGNVIAQHSVMVPDYAGFDTGGSVNLNLRDLWSSDARALLKQYYSYSPAERIESCFYTPTWMDFAVGASDATSRRIALYFADYDSQGRSVTVQVLDGGSHAVLDARPLSDYRGGVYLVYRYSGAVTFRIVNNNPGTYAPTGSVNAFFWGGSAGPPSDTVPPSVSIVNPASGVQVADRWFVTATAADNVGVAGVQMQLDGRDLLPEWTTPPFSQQWDTNFTPNGSHVLTAIARDPAGNRTTSAPITVVVNNVAPPPSGPNGNSVTFIGTDAVTLGNWKGVYGQDGNVMAQHSVLVPPYATFDTAGSVNLKLVDLWATDPRALLKQYYSYSPSERIESYFHTASTMDFRVGATDGKAHRISLYFCDYEPEYRLASLRVYDASTGATLDSRPLPFYQGGLYLVYVYSGNVIFRVVNQHDGEYSPTAAMSALFWGGSGLPQ